MKRTIIIPAIAIVLLALFDGPWLLLFVPVLLLPYFLILRKRGVEVGATIYGDLQEVENIYGEPDDVVVLDAAKANELSGLILFYTPRDIAIVAGEELHISDMVSAVPKNMATPYTIDEHAIILTMRNRNRQSGVLHLRVGYDANLALEIAKQIDSHIKKR